MEKKGAATKGKTSEEVAKEELRMKYERLIRASQEQKVSLSFENFFIVTTMFQFEKFYNYNYMLNTFT